MNANGMAEGQGEGRPLVAPTDEVSELPVGWLQSVFAEINGYVSKTIDPAQFADEVFELYSVPSFPTRRPEIIAGKNIGSTKQEVMPGDVLVCKINPRINRVWQVAPKMGNRQIASSEWIVLRAPDWKLGLLASLLFELGISRVDLC